MDKVTLYIADLAEAKQYYKQMYNQISEFRKERADSYYHEDDKVRSVVSAFLVKEFVKCEELTYNSYGKPSAINGTEFNVSHSQHIVVLAVAKREVGVDVEVMKIRDLSFFSNIFLEDEIKDASKEEKYLLWTNKESLVKCIGSGLSEIKEVPAKPTNGVKKYNGEFYHAKSFIEKDHAISVTVLGKEDFELEKKNVKIASFFKQ